MGLDTSHGCWHGAYSAFMRWRLMIAKLSGVPLMLMEGFYDPAGDHVGGSAFKQAFEWAAPREGGPLCRSYHGPVLHRWIEGVKEWLPISWSSLKPDPLHVLLWHSDCDGSIAAADCGPIADRLTELLPLLPVGDAGGHIGNWRDKTKTFIDGLRAAAAAGEDVEFH